MQHIKDFLNDEIVDCILKDIGFRLTDGIYQINSENLEKIKEDANKVFYQIFEIHYYYQNILEIKKQYAVENNLAPTKIDEYLCDHPDVDCLDYDKIVKEMRPKEENERQQKEKNKKNLDNMLQENKQRNHLGTGVHGYATKEKDNSYSKTYTSGELNKLNNSENTLNLSRQNSSSNDTRKQTGQRNEEKQNDFQNREGNNPRSPNPDQFKELKKDYLGTSVHGYATKEKDNSYSKTYTSGELNNSENTSNLLKENSSNNNETRKQTVQINYEKLNNFQNREGNNPRSSNQDHFKDSKKELNSQSNGNEKRFDKPQQFQCKNCDFWNNPDRYICPMCMQVC
jgi:hypothetical protein